MGILLNPDNIDFQEALNSEIYVDKTELMSYTNKVLRTEQKYICVSRPRRFGKSMAANMLTAYYSRGCDSRELFSKYKIAKADSFEKHLNKYNAIHINMVKYLDEAENIKEMVKFIEEDIIDEITEEFPDAKFPRRVTLINVLDKVFAQFKIPFIFIIDEWDCIFRRHKEDNDSQTTYLNFLRDLLKNKSYVALAYMTGILPIKKYGEHSARKSYVIERELPAGKGFADLVFKPRSNNTNPAMIVELKYDGSSESAIEQIKNKQYVDCLKDYSDEVLLVGIRTCSHR